MERPSIVTLPSEWIGCSFCDELEVIKKAEYDTIGRWLCSGEKSSGFSCKVERESTKNTVYSNWINSETCNLRACVFASLSGRFFSFRIHK